MLARGILTQYMTRMHLDGHPANASDPVRASVPVARRGTLLATRDGEGRWTFDVVVQGSGATVFFDL